jgi:hypothetical protein
MAILARLVPYGKPAGGTNRGRFGKGGGANMGFETVLKYMAALALPLWLAVEQIMAWWVFRQEAERPKAPAGALHPPEPAPVATALVEAGAHQASHRAA